MTKLLNILSRLVTGINTFTATRATRVLGRSLWSCPTAFTVSIILLRVLRPTTRTCRVGTGEKRNVGQIQSLLSLRHLRMHWCMLLLREATGVVQLVVCSSERLVRAQHRHPFSSLLGTLWQVTPLRRFSVRNVVPVRLRKECVPLEFMPNRLSILGRLSS